MIDAMAISTPRRYTASPALLRRVVEDVAILAHRRTGWTLRDDTDLSSMVEMDARLEALVDVTRTAGPLARQLADEGLASEAGGAAFLPALLALEEGELARLDALLALVATLPELFVEMALAFAWVSPEHLRGVLPRLLEHGGEAGPRFAIECCVQHRIDARELLLRLSTDPASTVRADALRAAGELGLTALRAACVEGCAATDDRERLESARSALLLGERETSIATLSALCLSDSMHQAAAARMLLQNSSPERGHALLATMRAAGATPSAMLMGAGWCGDLNYLPWLRSHLASGATDGTAPEAAEVAASTVEESHALAAIELITGLAPDEVRTDASSVERWIRDRGPNPGRAYFLGQLPTDQHLKNVLAQGRQVHRRQAAERLGARAATVGVFSCNAPVWRQQRLLAALTR